MIAFAGMLVEPAKRAGMATPPDPENFSREDFPHFFVFMHMQLGAAMPYAGCHWDNAKIIAAIPNNKIKKASPKFLRQRGFAMGYS